MKEIFIRFILMLVIVLLITGCSVNLDAEKFSKAYSDCTKLMNYMKGKVDRVVYDEGTFWCRGNAPDPIINEQDFIDRDHYSLKNDTVSSMLYAIELVEQQKIKIRNIK